MRIIIEIIFVITIILILIVNLSIRTLAKELKEKNNETNLSGFEIAKKISQILTKDEPHIIKKKGKFLDHYNYERNVIKLSSEVFDGTDMYAAGIALNVALETSDEKKNLAKGHKFTSIMVLTSYICIIIGAFLNNANILLFGFVIFVLAFIFEILLINLIAKTTNEIEDLYDFIASQEIIKPYEEYKEYILVLFLINIATLPYSFINYFR